MNNATDVEHEQVIEGNLVVVATVHIDLVFVEGGRVTHARTRSLCAIDTLPAQIDCMNSTINNCWSAFSCRIRTGVEDVSVAEVGLVIAGTRATANQHKVRPVYARGGVQIAGSDHGCVGDSQFGPLVRVLGV